MKSRHFLLYSALVMLVALSSCKLQEATITDPGKLYSTYSIGEKSETLDKLKEKGVKKGLMEKIIKYSEEDNWPEGIDELDERLDKRDLLMKYKVWSITEFDGKYILVIKPNKNKHMPEDMVGSKNIYFIIGKEGVTLVEKK